MRKFKTPNGNIKSEDTLRQTYGVDFDEYVEDGTFQLADEVEEGPGDEEIVGSGEMYVTPNGNEMTDIDLIKEYGSDKFTAYVSEGTFKKKANRKMVVEIHLNQNRKISNYRTLRMLMKFLKKKNLKKKITLQEHLVMY